MNQPGNALRRDRLNIQRAQSAVLVEKDGVEYAIVSDDNHPFDDPYVRAMYEAPEFIQLSPFGPPTPIGGSASAKKVSAGGKLGFVKDPFGKLGEPVFMGATLPLDGYGIVNLSLSPDGKVLLGQLKGGFSANIFDGAQRENQNHVWNVDLLLEAVLAHPDADRMSKHIKPDASAELRLPETGTGYLGAPVGTFFDEDTTPADVKGNMGDIVAVNLPRVVATRVLLKEGKISQLEAGLLWEKLDEKIKALISLRASQISVSLIKDSLEELTKSKDMDKPQTGMSLVTDGKDTDGKFVVLSRVNADGSGGKVDFEKKGAGILFLSPDISNDDLKKLRAGQSLTGKDEKRAKINFAYEDKAGTDKEGTGFVVVTAEEPNSAGRVFMGDRPLDNPGYSAFRLNGGVGINQDNDLLDVYRVEQRLRYLGYGVTALPGTEITVDGRFQTDEAQALKRFEKIVRFVSALGSGQGTANGVTVEIQYRATVAQDNDVFKFEEVPGSLRVIGNTGGLVGARLTTAVNAAKTIAIPLARQGAIRAAGFDTANIPETDSRGMDGVIEANHQDARRIATLNWLNAYNVPHWMQYSFGANSRLSGWSDRTDAVPDMGTSWLYDLMQVSQDNARAQNRATPLWFNGSGALGMTLNVGVNTGYVSAANQNQVNGQDFVLGVAPNTAPGNITNALAYNNRQWDYANAGTLAARLINPTNNQPSQPNQAMLDFLTVYSATQGQAAGDTNGLRDDITINSANPDTIRRALFGDGTQAGGLIDSGNVLLGGTATAIGGAMTAKSLAALLDIEEHVAQPWVEPLQQAMTEFNINTPQRIAAFLA